MPAIEMLEKKLRALGGLGKPLLIDLKRVTQDSSRYARKVSALSAFSQVTNALTSISSQQDIERVLDSILSAALELSLAERGLLVLVDDSLDGFSIRASRKLEGGGASEALELSKSLIRQILAREESIVTTDVKHDARFVPEESLLALDIRSVMATPIRQEGKVIGGLYVDTLLTEHTFSTEDVETLSIFADHAAVALKLATSIQATRELYLQSVLALVNAVEAADAYTAGHSSRVGYYARGLADELGYPPEACERVAVAGYLHDIGKIALKFSFSTRSTLTDTEWEQIKQHPVYGERILRDSPALADILPAVRSHHERWQGGGYPDGLANEAIHPYARIVAVADAFDAMTTQRPYRGRMPPEEALTEIESEAGKQFERCVAKAFVTAYRQGSLQLAKGGASEDLLRLLLFDD